MVLLAWACVGAMGAIGVGSLLTVGIFVLPATVVVALVLAWLTRDRPSAPLFGLGIGAALVVAYVGWLNHDGPGRVCREYGRGGSECLEEWAPWPFYLAALLLTAASVAFYVHFSRTQTASPGKPTPR